MSLLENVGLFLRPPDWRSRRQVVDEVAEELEFHIAMRARASEEAGMDAAAARRDAEKRFGDMAAIRSACARVQIGEWRVLQRINFVLMVALLGVVAYFGWQFASSREETAELVGGLRGDMAELTEAVRGREVAAGAAVDDGLGMSTFVDTDGDGLPDARVPMGGRAAVEPEAPPLEADAWLARFGEEMDWRDVVAIGKEIAALEPDVGLALMRELYPQLPTVFARQQILKAFVFGDGHPRAVEVLDLAASDPELAVQGWAFGYLEDYAFQDFSDDYEGYLAWRARYGGMAQGELLVRNARELAGRLAGLGPEELTLELRAIEDLDLGKGAAAEVDLARELRDAGLLDSIREWLISADLDSRAIAAGWLEQLQPGEAWLRLEVEPLLCAGEGFEPRLVSAACAALGQPGNGWAVEPLVESLRRAPAGDNGILFDHAGALADIGDPRAIPALIALLDADETGSAVYGIGYYGLQELTGVRYDESHDGAWWREWWAENRHRLPAEVRDLALPDLAYHR